MRIVTPPESAVGLEAATLRLDRRESVFDAKVQLHLRPHDVLISLVDNEPTPALAPRWGHDFPAVESLAITHPSRTAFEGQYARGSANLGFRFHGRYFQLIAFFGETPTAADLARANAFLTRVRVS